MYRQQRTVRILSANTTITYYLERKKVKNINLRIKPDGTIFVSANKRIAVNKLDELIQDNAAKILQLLQNIKQRAKKAPMQRKLVDGESFKILGTNYVLKLQTGAQDSVSRCEKYLYISCRHAANLADYTYKQQLLDNYFKAECRRIFTAVVSEVHALFAAYHLAVPTLTIRKMKTRWGSCNYFKKKICLNSQLLQAPLPCIRHVVIHEFCHFIWHDHSRNFYALLGSIEPDWREHKALLLQEVSLS